MKKTNRRLCFAIIWSVLSLVGLTSNIVPFFASEFGGILLYLVCGFHVPGNSLYFCTLFGLFTDYPGIGLVYIAVFVVFFGFWIASLIRINKSSMIEYLIIGDRVVSLLMLLFAIIVQRSEFSAWWLLIVFAIDLVITALVVVNKLKLKKGITNHLSEINP